MTGLNNSINRLFELNLDYCTLKLQCLILIIFYYK
jgi:hypothetical protein